MKKLLITGDMQMVDLNIYTENCSYKNVKDASAYLPKQAYHHVKVQAPQNQQGGAFLPSQPFPHFPVTYR